MNLSLKQHNLLKMDQIMVIDILVPIFFCDLPAIYNSLQPLGDGPDQSLAEHLVCVDLLPLLPYHTLQMGLFPHLYLLHPLLEDWPHLLYWPQVVFYNQSSSWRVKSNKNTPIKWTCTNMCICRKSWPSLFRTGSCIQGIGLLQKWIKTDVSPTIPLCVFFQQIMLFLWQIHFILKFAWSPFKIGRCTSNVKYGAYEARERNCLLTE